MTQNKITAELYEFIVKVIEDKVREIRVTREEFDKLAAAINRLAEAQARTEERLNKLTEAQQRTEQRLNQLVATVEKLAERVEQLAEAQQRTEQRLNQLAERVEQLAEAQQRTEQRLNQLAATVEKLAEAVDGLRQEVGKLSETVGFGLEDIARVVLPGWLYRHLGVELEELERRFVIVDGREIEVNLYGEGLKRGKEVVVVGEAKSRIYGRDVNKFYEEVYRPIAELSEREVIGILFGYLIHPSAQKRAKELGLYVVASYQR